MRRIFTLTVLLALVPTWLSASGCMVCPHMIGHGDGAEHENPQASHVQADHDSHDSHALESHGSEQTGHTPSVPGENCPCDSFCCVAPVALELGSPERAPSEELSTPVLQRPETRALLIPERPPFFLPLWNAPPALG